MHSDYSNQRRKSIVKGKQRAKDPEIVKKEKITGQKKPSGSVQKDIAKDTTAVSIHRHRYAIIVPAFILFCVSIIDFL